MQFQDHKLVFRRYAHLFFIMCIDQGDNELAVLEAIHLFVEILDNFFTKVTELDIVLNFHKARGPCLLLCPATPPAARRLHVHNSDFVKFSTAADALRGVPSGRART